MNPPSKQIADSKLITFAVGQQKKSRFQKAREEQEQKRKQDDEETAKVYDSFVSSFKDDDDGKTFVRGGLSRDIGDSTYGNRGDVYKFDRRGDRMMQEMEERAPDHSARQAPASAAASGKGKRQIDDFLSEIINRQESLPSRGDRREGGRAPAENTLSTSLDGGFIEKGSYDNGDPTTTNLYLGNINPATTEERLTELFGRYGEINSVKIMWPRTEEEKAKKRNCGFVSYMRRRDAEDALIELQDYELDGFKMMLGWGKAVKINAGPIPASQRTAADNAALDILLPQAKQQLLGVPPTPTVAVAAPPLAAPVPLAYAPPPGLAGQPPFPGGYPPHSMAPPPPGHFPPPQGPPPSHWPVLPAPAPGQHPHPPACTAALPPVHMPPPSAVHASLPPPPFQAPPSLPPPPSTTTAPVAKVSASTEDLANMSVDSFLDSITSGSNNGGTQGPPVFQKPPTALPASQPPSIQPTTLLIAPPAAAPVTAPAASTVPPSPLPLLQPDIVVTLPDDPKQQALIDLVAKYCASDGEVFERAVKQREESNPLFAFLFDLESPEGQYYRWRTYANVWGDTAKKWSAHPVRWSIGGLIIAPPPCVINDHTPDDIASAGRENRKRSLSRSRSRSRSRSHGRERRHHRHRDEHDRGRRRTPSPDHHGGGRMRSDSLSDRRPAHEDGYKRSRRCASRSRSRSRDRDRDRGRDRRDGSRDRDRPRGGPARESARAREERERADRSRYAGMTGAQIEREKAKKRLEQLSRLRSEDYEAWKDLLKALDLSRTRIKEAMGFAFDKIECAGEIISMLKDRLILPSSYAAVKIAGLYLLSDILHNTAAPVKHASTYRGLIQNALPEVMEDLSVLFHNTAGRMSAFNIEDRVKKMFAVWAEWSVFPTLYLVGLQATFYMTTAERNALREHVDMVAQAEALDGVSVGAAAAAEAEALEQLRKRARLAAVPHTDQTSRHELQYRLDHAERYLRTKYGDSGAAAISTLLAPALREEPSVGVYSAATEEGDDDDIDGAPLDIAALTPLERILAQQIEDSGNAGPGGYDEDDIDGVPINLAEYTIPVSSDTLPPQ